MQRHTVIGDALCGELRALQHVRPIVRHHHERPDGSGYPDGLRGDADPAARVHHQRRGHVRRAHDRSPLQGGLYTPVDACRELREEAARGWKHVEIVEAFIALLDSGGLERFEP